MRDAFHSIQAFISPSLGISVTHNFVITDCVAKETARLDGINNLIPGSHFKWQSATPYSSVDPVAYIGLYVMNGNFQLCQTYLWWGSLGWIVCIILSTQINPCWSLHTEARPLFNAPSFIRYSISHQIYTWFCFALFCCVCIIIMIAPVPVKQPWIIWVESTGTRPHQNTIRYEQCLFSGIYCSLCIIACIFFHWIDTYFQKF